MALQPFVDLGRFFSFLICSQTVGTLGGGINPPQICVNTGSGTHLVSHTGGGVKMTIKYVGNSCEVISPLTSWS
jgi:hypothetical protein